MDEKEIEDKRMTFFNDMTMIEMNNLFDCIVHKNFATLFDGPQSITSEKVNALRDEIIQLAKKLDDAVTSLHPRTIGATWQSYLPASLHLPPK